MYSSIAIDFKFEFIFNRIPFAFSIYKYILCQTSEKVLLKKTGPVASSKEVDSAAKADAERVMQNLRQTHEHFGHLAKVRRLALERSARFFSFLDASEDLSAWLEER